MRQTEFKLLSAGVNSIEEDVNAALGEGFQVLHVFQENTQVRVAMVKTQPDAPRIIGNGRARPNRGAPNRPPNRGQGNGR